MRVVEVDAVATHDLRRRLLRSHRPGLPVRNPEDALPGTFHLAEVDDDGALLGVASFTRDGSAARLRGMAVEPDAQGHGVGRLLMDAALERLRNEGVQRLWCHARNGALGFYERFGMRLVGEGFVEIDVPHHLMEMQLS
jgi:GNAT superfamily N-acetyltransferase